MYNNDYMYAIERSDEYLAHYGIRGMKWGVRKAREMGGERGAKRLSKQYAKASKKLAKLEKRAANSGKYARRAALMGAGAAAAGGLAAAGTKGLTTGMGHLIRGTRATGNALMNVTKGHSGKVAKAVRGTGLAMIQTSRAGGGMHDSFAKAAKAMNTWGNSNSIGNAVKIGGRKFQNANSELVAKVTRGKGIVNTTDKLGKVSNNTIARIGAGVVGAGLAAGAAKNAYRAATAKSKAAKFKTEMNKAFAGTQYANKPRQGKKRRK